jgi:putative RNA 2'-phosphotransferase
MTRKASHARGSLEKLLRYALGLRPDEFGLVLSDDGSVPLKELLPALRGEEGLGGLDLARIKEAARNAPDRAFEIEEDRIRLKASLAKLPPERGSGGPPPRELFVALKEAAWVAVSAKGLYPRKTDVGPVRLFKDQAMALKVAARSQRDPALVRVSAGKAMEAGVPFTPYGEEIWLSPGVPKEYLHGPRIKAEEAARDQAKGKAEKDKAAKDPAGAWPPLGIFPSPVASHGKEKGKYSDSPAWKNQARRDRRGRGNDRGDRG